MSAWSRRGSRSSSGKSRSKSCAEGREMNRRQFVVRSATAMAAAAAGGRLSIARPLDEAGREATPNLDLNRHRFGVNYTPSHNWYFCWNDWNPDPIRRDLDAIAALGADHMRIMLVWPFFQPNPR